MIWYTLMSAETITGKEKIQGSETESIEYSRGTLDYLHIKAEQVDTSKNPIVVAPGFTQGIEVLEDFGQSLSDSGHREVFVLDQWASAPRKSRQPKQYANGNFIGLEEQAEAVASFLEHSHLTDRPIDFVANSFGCQITARVAEIAEEQGWNCFKDDLGSHTIFISPAASNEDENYISLGVRWTKWMAKNDPHASMVAKVLDPGARMLKEGKRNASENPKKTLKEIDALVRSRVDYQRLGKIGLKPFVMAYADDDLMPYGTMEQNLENNLENLSGISMPVDAGAVKARDFEMFKTNIGLQGKAAKEAWAHHWRRADHGDMQFHPERTARAILQILDR